MAGTAARPTKLIEKTGLTRVQLVRLNLLAHYHAGLDNYVSVVGAVGPNSVAVIVAQRDSMKTSGYSRCPEVNITESLSNDEYK